MNEIKVAERVGKNLKYLIKKSKYKTQDKFAIEAMHVDPSTVRRWISQGIRDINVIEEIAEVLEVDFVRLFVEEE